MDRIRIESSFLRYFTFAAVIAVLLLSGCASTPGSTQPENPREEESEIFPDSQWKKVTSLEQMEGLWISSNGNSYEWPFNLNRKMYLRFAWSEQDDTALWVSFAKNHNRAFSDVWNHRFSYINAVYGENLPAADENGSQLGIKLRADYSQPYSHDVPFRIYARKEMLVPEQIAELNTGFFMRRGDEVKESGEFDFHSFKFQNITSDGQIYLKSCDYWKE
jgi:hypothetical protein